MCSYEGEDHLFSESDYLAIQVSLIVIVLTVAYKTEAASALVGASEGRGVEDKVDTIVLRAEQRQINEEVGLVRTESECAHPL